MKFSVPTGKLQSMIHMESKFDFMTFVNPKLTQPL